MAAAKIGAPADSVDDAVRAFYEKLVYGPRYRLPGLSHRTGHGVGLDVHEPVNLVHGEATPLAEGMLGRVIADLEGVYDQHDYLAEKTAALGKLSVGAHSITLSSMPVAVSFRS